MNDGLDPMKPKKKKPQDYYYFRKDLTIGHLPDGTPIRKRLYAGTQEELDRKYNELWLKHFGPANDGITVEDWCPTWIEVYKATLTRQNRESYEARMRLHICPHIGHMKIKDVKNSDLISIVNMLQGQKRKSVEKILQAVKQFFRDAMDEGLIERNPAVNLRMPKKTTKKKKNRPFSKEEVEIIFKAINQHKYGPFMETLYYTGLRSGELAAVKRCDVDLELQRLHITDAVSKDDDNKYFLSGSTKGEKLRGENYDDDENIVPRIVPIPNKFMPTIIKLCKGLKDDDLLFPWKGGCLSSGTRQSWWGTFKRQCYIEAGVKVGKWGKVIPDPSLFDDTLPMRCFRNTYSTNLRSVGIDKTGREDLLGHKRTDVNDLYTAWSEEDFIRMAKNINAFFDGISNNDDDDETAPVKTIATKTITTLINTSLHSKIINISINLRVPLSTILSDAVKGFSNMYEANLRGTLMAKSIQIEPIGDSVITVDIISEERLLDSMDTIVAELGVPPIDLYSYAIEWYVDMIKQQ